MFAGDRWVGVPSDPSVSGLFGLHSFFFLTAIIGLYSMHRLRMVHEAREVDGHVVIAHLVAQAKKAVRHVSKSVGSRRL